MPTTLKATLRLAASQIGYVEQGGPDNRSGNITKYWHDTKPSMQGQPWCACFAPTWLFTLLKSMIIMDNTQYFYCPYIETFAKKKGRWSTTPQVGSFVLYSFGKSVAVHVGIVEKVLPNGMIQTIEGNTSPTNVGSQNNGGGVYRRVRPTNWGIRGYFYPAYAPEPVVKPVVKPITPVDLAVDGDLGPLTIKALQRWIGISASGIWNDLSKKALQRRIGTTPDGIIGGNTINHLQVIIGHPQTGHWYNDTTAYLQRYLNKR